MRPLWTHKRVHTARGPHQTAKVGIPGPAQFPPVSSKLRPDWAGGVALGTSRLRRRGIAQPPPPPRPARSGRPAPEAASESPDAPRAADTVCRRRRLLRPVTTGAHLSRRAPAPLPQPSRCARGPAPSPPTPNHHPPATRQPFQIFAGGRPAW